MKKAGAAKLKMVPTVQRVAHDQGTRSFGPPPVSPAAVEMHGELKRLGLMENIAELEILGYTVIPPEKAAPKGFAARLRKAILDVSERRYGVRPDMGSGGTHANPLSAFGHLHTWMLFEDDVFQEAMCNEIGVALTHYLLGKNAVASNCIAIVKGPGGGDLGLHADNALMASPFPAHAQVCNVTFALTDYTKENGALCFVPGSHRYFRSPVGRRASTSAWRWNARRAR